MEQRRSRAARRILELKGEKSWRVFAEELGIPYTSLWNWSHGTWPSLQKALEIEEATGGKIRVEDWQVTA